VRETLADAGIWGVRSSRRLDDGETSSARLGRALEDLGPLFQAFGRYLSSRIDLLPLPDCIELAKARGAASSSTPIDRVRESVRLEAGGSGEALWSYLEDPPLRCGLLHQWHRATLPSGERWVVKILRPELEERITVDTEPMRVLKEARFVGEDGRRVDLAVVVEAFIEHLRREMDLGNEASALAKLGESHEGEGGLASPKLVSRLCSRRVLCFEELPGRAVTELVPTSGNGGSGQSADLARRICLAWLTETLLAGLCPEGTIAEDLLLLPEDRFALTGGPLARLGAKSRRNLLDYMTAVAREEPDQACTLLLRENRSNGGEDLRDRLRPRFRQGEPFRQGSWSDAYAGKRLADTLFVQWRLAHQAGFRPPPHLVSFYRGLFGLELFARSMTRRRDPLGEGLEDFRVIAAAVRLRERLGPTQLKDNAERFLPVMEELLQRFGEVSLLVQQGRVDENRGTATEPRRVSWTVVGGLLLLVVSVAVSADRIVTAQPSVNWIEGVAALGFVSLAAILLWNVRGGKRE